MEKNSPNDTNSTTIRNNIRKRFEYLSLLYIHLIIWGREHSIHSTYSYIFYTIPSFYHPITSSFLFYFTTLLFPLYTITDLSFGVVPGGNPALSPIILVDAGSTSKRSNSELSSGAVCGNRTHDHMVKIDTRILSNNRCVRIFKTKTKKSSALFVVLGPNCTNKDEHKYSSDSKAGQEHIRDKFSLLSKFIFIIFHILFILTE